MAAGIVLALDTSSVAACLRMLTEPPFTALLTAAVAAAVSGALGPRPRPALAAAFGALSAAAALTRPVGLFLVFPAAAWLLLCGRARHWRRADDVVDGRRLRPPLAADRGRLAGAQPAWRRAPTRRAARRRRFLLLSRGGDIVSQRDGVPFELARAGLMREVVTTAQRTGEREDTLYLREGVALVARHPMLFLRTQVRWLPELLLGTGAAPLLDSMGLGARGGPGPARAATVIRALSVLHLLVTYAAFAWAVFTAARSAEGSHRASARHRPARRPRPVFRDPLDRPSGVFAAARTVHAAGRHRRRSRLRRRPAAHATPRGSDDPARVGTAYSPTVMARSDRQTSLGSFEST